MKNYTIGLYQISINERHHKDKKVILSDYNYGQDLLKQLKNLLESWENEEQKGLVKNEQEKKISRILKKDDGTYELYSLGRYISGIIESGEFGTEENIINSITGELKYHKNADDAQMIPFFFIFYIPENSHKGYLLIERIGNIGIYSTLTKSIQNYIGPILEENLVLKIEPLMLKAVFDKNLNVVSDAKKIILKGVHYKDLNIQQISNNLIECEKVNTEITFSAPKNKYLSIKNWLNKLNSQKTETDRLVFQNFEYSDVAFELKIGGKTKTVSIARIYALGTYLEVTDSIEIGKNGYPTYKSLLNEAQILLSYIKDEEIL